MPKCTANALEFGRLGRRVTVANFEGGALSSDGGLVLVRQVDRRLGLSAAVADALHDPRDPERITHTLRELVAQRLYGLVCGYEDLNDHAQLRGDQEQAEFHAYYDHHCYLPLYVFAARALLACVLRRSRIDGASMRRP